MSGSPLLGLSQRVPPSNLQAEQALLGGLLANAKAYDDVAARLRPDHFADPAHGAIYAAIARRLDAGQLADAVVLTRDVGEWAHSFDTVEAARRYMAELLAAMVSPRMVTAYADAVIDCWHRRALIEIGAELVEAAFLPGERTARAIHEEAEERLGRLAAGQDTDNPLVPAHSAMGLAIDDAVRMRDVPGALIGLTTGLSELDRLTGGWRPGQFVVVGGRPSMGKTGFGLSTAGAAAAAGARVLFFSMEMSPKAIGAALVAGTTPISRHAALRGRVPFHADQGRYSWRPVTDGEVDAMLAAQRAMAERRLVVVDFHSKTVAALRAIARREKRRGGLDLIVVDYLGLMRVPELAHSDNRVLEMSRLSEGAKALARDLDVPVVMLAQLNRQVEMRPNKRPQLADLRDSGALEQDADTVIFLYRDWYYLSRDTPSRTERDTEEAYANKLSAHALAVRQSEGKAELIVAKLREGQIGTAQVAFGHETTWFTDLPEGMS